MPLSRHAHSARFGSERPSALSPSPSSRVAFGDSGALFRRCAAVASKRIMMNRKSFAPRTSPSVPFQAASGLGATARNASDLQGQARNWGGGARHALISAFRPSSWEGEIQAWFAPFAPASLVARTSCAPLSLRCCAALLRFRRCANPSVRSGAGRSRSRGLSVSDPGSWTCSSHGCNKDGSALPVCSCSCSIPASRNREASAGPHRS